MNIDKGGLQRLQCEVDRTMFSTMVYNFSDLDMSFKDHFKSRKGGTVTHVLYLNVTGSGWLVISGLNVTSQNTDYHHMLYFHGESNNKSNSVSHVDVHNYMIVCKLYLSTPRHETITDIVQLQPYSDGGKSNSYHFREFHRYVSYF